MRVFVAVFPPPEIRAAAAARAGGAIRRLDRSRLADRVRWIRPANVHLTLKFLGDGVRGEDLEGLRTALSETCTRHAPFDAVLAGLGAFPSARRARVLWSGVGRGSDELRELATGIDAALSSLGFGREERPYTPHLTLGRVRGRPVTLDLPQGTEDPTVEDLEFRVEQVELMESRLDPGGASYEVIGTFALGGAIP